jgi:hypothetical protein
MLKLLLATLISWAMPIVSAFAQGTPAASADGFPWFWVLVGIVAAAGAIWWYMTRIRKPRA